MLNGFLRFVTFGRSKSHAVTIGGWTPGIGFLAAGHPLSCGCLAGIYHTLSKDVAEIIDAPANECPYRHDRNLVLWRRPIDEYERGEMLDYLFGNLRYASVPESVPTEAVAGADDLGASDNLPMREDAHVVIPQRAIR
jgi:hypothetical protein